MSFFSGSSNLKGVSYDTTSASENVVDSFSRIRLVLGLQMRNTLLEIPHGMQAASGQQPSPASKGLC